MVLFGAGHIIRRGCVALLTDIVLADFVLCGQAINGVSEPLTLSSSRVVANCENIIRDVFGLIVCSSPNRHYDGE